MGVKEVNLREEYWSKEGVRLEDFCSMRGSAQLNYIDFGGALQSTAVMIMLHV